MLSTQFNRDNQHQAIIKPSLLAGCIALALLPSAAFAAPATEETVIVEGSATAPDDGENDYNVTSTSAGTKMQMTQRDIPQSVTIVSQQRMEDQQLQTLGEVMENTLGISKSQADSDRALYYSRGFQIDNYMVDGIPTYFESRWNLGDALSDMALFERVEVVRGATGLMTGTVIHLRQLIWFENTRPVVNLKAMSRRNTVAGTKNGMWRIYKAHSPKTVKSAHELSAATRITTHGWTATTVKRPSSPALSMLI